MKRPKKEACSINKKPLIDATGKSSIIFVPIRESLSPEEIEKEIQQSNSSIDRIRGKYYSQDAAIKRIQSRTLTQIYHAKRQQVFMQLRNAKIIRGVD